MSALLKQEPLHHHVVIIGGGQAGLSLSWHMTRAGVDHVVLERREAFHVWKNERWDSFCLVTPNWQCNLPGYEYIGNEPNGFMAKAEVVRFVTGFANAFNPPVLEGVEATALVKSSEGFAVHTRDGRVFTAAHVCVATGGPNAALTPPMAERLPAHLTQLHANSYRNAAELPDGAVLVVGSGQSGCEIAEDLHLAGRRVHLSTGSAPRIARFYRGRDTVEWLHDMGHYDLTVVDEPLRRVERGKANHYVTGRDGGRDIDLRRFAQEGMRLHGHLVAVTGATLGFAPDLKANLDEADRVCDGIKDGIDAFIAERGIAAPEEPRHKPVWQPPEADPPVNMMKENITAVIWCVGYRADYDWIHLPAFTGHGAPSHKRGVTDVRGLYFLGLPWLYSWGSGRFESIARDAAYISNQILGASRRNRPQG